MSIPNLLDTDTFRTWANLTNQLITALNANVLFTGATTNGAFTVNGSLQVVNTFLANSSAVRISGNTTFNANALITSCNVWHFTCDTLLLEPLSGTTVNSVITFLANVYANAAVSISADVTQSGNLSITGTETLSGPLITRQVLFGAANAQLTPATINAPQLDDYSPAGLTECQVVNLNTNIDTVITGIAAPTNVASGARILYLQNISSGFKITLASANNSSLTNNQFKLPNNVNLDVPAGTAIALLYSTTNHQWRPLWSGVQTITSLIVSGNSALGNTTISGWANLLSTMQVAGNAAISGTLAVTGVSTHTGNATFSGFANVGATLQVGSTSQLNGNVTVGDRLSVASVATVSGNLTVSGLSTHTGNATFNGFVNVGSTLQVAGNTSFAGGLQVTGNVAVGAAVSANGSSGTTGQVLTSAGNGNAYWGDALPAGSVIPYVGSAAPAGNAWLMADGSLQSKATYPALFVACGTTFGAGNTTHFVLPDMRQRFPLGKAAAGTGSTLGSTGGTIDQTHTIPQQTVTTGYPIIPNSLALNNNGGNLGFYDGATFFDSVDGYTPGTIGSSAYGIAATITSPTNPPYLVLNYLIRTGL